MWETICYLAAELLIPLLPAMLLYRFLPSETRLSGDSKLITFLNGINFQLTGAFAGYFLLVLMAFYHVHTQSTATIFKTYSIEGRLNIANRKKDDFNIYASPPNYHINPDGSFNFKVIVNNSDGDELPHLVFENPENNLFQPETIDLRDGSARASGKSYRIKREERGYKITVEDTIELQKIDIPQPYHPTQESLPLDQTLSMKEK